jgi:hypothetical protein
VAAAQHFMSSTTQTVEEVIARDSKVTVPVPQPWSASTHWLRKVFRSRTFQSAALDSHLSRSRSRAGFQFFLDRTHANVGAINAPGVQVIFETDSIPPYTH